MNLTGKAFLALWNGVDLDVLDAYEDWHSREHVPERLTVPGILAAWRYRARGVPAAGFFTLYDLADVQVLDSVPYRRLLNHPTPASARMRPRLTGLARVVCRISRREPTGDHRFVAPCVTAETTAIPPSPPGMACQIGTVDIAAPGHPVAGVHQEPGQVILVEGDEEKSVRTGAEAVVAQAPIFELIETALPAR